MAVVMREGYELAKPHSGLRTSSAGALASVRRRAAPAAVQLAPEVGRFFQDLRRIFQLSREQAAQKLATRTDIIAALEAGDVRALPPWAETCRIVRTYAGFARLDPRPVLHSIETLMAQSRCTTATVPQPYLARWGQRSASALAALGNIRSKASTAEPAARSQATRRGRHVGGGALFAIAVPVALLVLLTQTTILEAAVSQLPAPVARMVRGAQDYVTLQLAPVRNGLRWIDVADPRTRRGDKLPIAGQPD